MFVETFQVAVKKLIAFIKGKDWTTKGEGGAQQSCISFLLGSVIFLFFYVLNTREEETLLSSRARGFFLQFYFSL